MLLWVIPRGRHLPAKMWIAACSSFAEWIASSSAARPLPGTLTAAPSAGIRCGSSSIVMFSAGPSTGIRPAMKFKTDVSWKNSRGVGQGTPAVPRIAVRELRSSGSSTSRTPPDTGITRAPLSTAPRRSARDAPDQDESCAPASVMRFVIAPRPSSPSVPQPWLALPRDRRRRPERERVQPVPTAPSRSPFCGDVDRSRRSAASSPLAEEPRRRRSRRSPSEPRRAGDDTLVAERRCRAVSWHQF